MDSFFNAPRQPPPPPKISPIERIPMVPEVSLMENSFFASNQRHFSGNSSFLSKKHVRFRSPNVDKENIPQSLKAAPNLNGKTFKQIYMANIPDRHLDLSIFEPFSQTNVLENQTHSRGENFVPPDFPNSNSKSPFLRENSRFNCTEISTQMDKTCKEIDEPTIKDLFKIIQQQNEQIMILQRQVNNLKASIRQPECDSVPIEPNSPTKKNLFSFDVKATSFEFSFRPQNKFRKQNDFLEPKIQEIVECDRNSLHLDESLNIRESYVSDVPSIEIKMDDYHSSDDEGDSPNSDIGLTFYQDLMDQVNNVLKKVQTQSECKSSMGAVKQATLQHLKKIGVNLSPIQESNEASKSELNLNDPSEISCAVQQLLMKYLPEDKLVKAVKNSPKQLPQPPNGEFSFATLQYMKKYNLIDNTKKSSETTPKILNITALKMQPKLL